MPQTPSKTISKSTTPRNSTNMLLLVLLAIAAAAFLWSFFSYSQAKQEIAALTDPNIRNELSRQETQELVAKVSKLMVLPNEESPVVATIQDVETLASQQNFYKDAHKGDKLIIYSQAQKAIIYDENRNLVVNVGPVYFQSQPTDSAGFNKVAGRLNVEIRNGSQAVGKGADLRDRLKSIPELIMVRLAKAVNANYPATILVDLSDGSKSDLIAKLEQELNVTAVKTLPQNEVESKAEAVVIVGN